jgi:hypothetical protein
MWTAPVSQGRGSTMIVEDHNLGVFTITEIALKIANAVPPAHFISGVPNTAYGDL